MFRRTQVLLLLALTVAAATFFGPGARPASAHSELLRTAPAFGQKVAGPTEFMATYDQPVDLHGSTIELHGAGDRRFPIGKLGFRGSERKVVGLSLPDLKPGHYRVSWFVTGDDGHVEGAEIVFEVARSAAEADPAPAPEGTAAAAPAVEAPAAGLSGSASGPPAPVTQGPAGTTPPRKFARFAPTVRPATPPTRAPNSTDLAILGPGASSSFAIGSAVEPPRTTEAAADADEIASDAPGRLVSGQRIGSSGLAAVATTTRFVGFVGLSLLVGGLVFTSMLWPAGASLRRTQRFLWIGLIASLAATALTFGLTGAGLRGLGPIDALRPSVAYGILGSHLAHVLTARMLFLALAFPLVALLVSQPELGRNPLWRLGALVSAAGAVATHALIGHPYSEGGLASTAAFVHLAGVVVWLGGLVLLAAVVLPRREADEILYLVPHFSRLAFAAVTTMVVSGTALLVLISPDWGKLVGSGYGRFLILKLLLVTGLLAAASKARNFTQRYLLIRSTVTASSSHGVPVPVNTPGVRGGVALAVATVDDRPADGAATTVRLQPLVVACALEVALALAVLSATAVLVGRPPA